MDKLPLFDMWLNLIKEEQESVLATVLPNSRSETRMNQARLLLSRGNSPLGNLGEEKINFQVTEIAKKKLQEVNPKSETYTFTIENGKEMNIFVDVYIPPSEIMIFGAGHDAMPVAKYAVSLGFKTTVVDQRRSYNNEERFPNTNILILSPDDFHDQLNIGHRTYIIVMNHHLQRDIETLKFVLPSIAPYIGVLGPHSRRIRMLKAIESEGVIFNDDELKRMYSPIGLDIGSATSEEIAISIMAEVIAKKNGHTAGFLRDSEHIHHQGNTKMVV